MGRPKKIDPYDIEKEMQSIIDVIKDQIQEEQTERIIPDIITFCYDKKYLNLKSSNITLFNLQEIILKIFYRGQEGNENLKLSSEQIQFIKNEGYEYLLEKYESGNLFRELVLVLGRRAGKDFLTSIIALYEAMKLLECPGGCPYKFYNIAEGNPIYILTVANSSDQARVLFQEMSAKLQNSEYFRLKIGFWGSERIHLLTPEDRKKKKAFIDKGQRELADRIQGSVVIMSGHSNSDALLGKGVFGLLLDEVASFKSSGIMSGDRIYTALTPAQAAFSRIIGTDEQGEEIRQLDAKTISISSPRSEEGVFYKLWRDAPNVSSRLAFKAPTWKVNTSIKEKMLRNEYKLMNPTEFNMEFGAQFSGTAGEKFIADEYVDKAFELGANLGQEKAGKHGMVYYVHLDPASRSHNYALVLLHVEERIRTIANTGSKPRKEHVKYFIVDHMKAWVPGEDGNKSINVLEVDKYISNLARNFKIGMVTFDAWNSEHSKQRLRSKGVPTKITPFKSKYKMYIYDHLEHLLVNNQLALPKMNSYANLMEMELKCLKRIYTPLGFKIKPDDTGIIMTDDLADALAGACASAISYAYAGYAKPVTAYTPQGGANNRFWNIGGGTVSNSQWKFYNRKFGI